MFETSSQTQGNGNNPMHADTGKTSFELLSEIWSEQLALCDALEKVADALPDGFEKIQCLRLARTIPAVVDRAHKLEELLLFPLLQERAATSPAIAAVIDRLRYEHLEDDAYADELYDALNAHGWGRPKPSAETLGYMLRTFFAAMRRHIWFDRDVVMPLLLNGCDENAAYGLSRSAP
jgi:hemerythrin-like domain-containing protein